MQPAKVRRSAPQPAPARRSTSWKRTAFDLLQTVILAIILAFLIKSFLVQTYVVEGTSMDPTLHNGDRVLVNRLVYRLREPKPGEMVVFRDPEPEMRMRVLVKRVIGVPGDRIEYKQGQLFVNGRPVDEHAYAHDTEQCSPDTEKAYGCDVPAYTVGPGELFVAGDNRPHSYDSRDPRLRRGTGAAVQLADVQGKAVFRFWPLSAMGVLHDAARVFATSA